MRAPAKFLFDVDFTSGAKTANSLPLVEHKARIAEAETQGYRNGFIAGQAEAKAETARQLAIALEQISRALDRIAGSLSSIEGRLEAEAVEVAVAVARKLAPELMAREPFAEIAALATNCLQQLVAAPHVVVRVGDEVYAQAREQLDDIARKVGFEGRLVVLAEPEIDQGDCRIEWADGGMTRNRAGMEEAIVETVGRYVAARRPTAPDS